ncbi:hypothetical protein [Streptomyces sp. HUAS TT20]|uniref:hypothetical protein n=1 Tax=Streptomyces sp. HUAS TT20 TaxID=3447509 RepID=UPI0021DB75B7|nr:hypothetical protein [Streptomyces sp. HUAS 15-9]UXY33237.1 hypothetical protein N8I87_43825 [Streptomyces sp. HUAS 15-9]
MVGDEHSDVPVVLPTEAIELDGFRRAHAHDTFWCGVLLGGCGAQLAHKLYIDRQCHFQHFPQPNGAPHACRRPRVGESSADHLYVKSAMSRSLLEHGRAGRFAFPQPIGSLLDVDLEDGLSLRVHMDGLVPPDWAGGRTVVLGPGVVPDPGVLSSCPYVYRVRCESDGADRRVWIGTQSLARSTDWVPLADCVWTDDGLITPAAAQILRDHAAAPAHATETGHCSGALPKSVIRFIRGLEAAQRSGTVEHVRRLCAGSGPFLDSLDGAARAEAEQAVQEARTWLTGHEDYQQRVFAGLDQAVTEKRAFDVRSQLPTAVSLTRRGASAAEQRVLAAARAFLREQDGLPAAGSARTVLTPLTLPPPRRPQRKRSKPQEAPRSHKAPKEQQKKEPKKEKPKREEPKKEPNTSRKERRARRAAVVQARSILQHLDQRFHLSTAEQRRLTEELAPAVETAGDWLSDSERQEASFWIRRMTRAKKRAEERQARQARRELAPGVVESAAAAVRGALKKAAREQTTTSWHRLEQQLGSALPHMTLADRVQVLTLADRATPADQALLSCLVAAGDPDMTTPYREVAGALGLGLPDDDDDLRDLLQANVQQVHEHWRYQ